MSSQRYPALTQTKPPSILEKNVSDQGFTDLDEFSPLSDFENAVQDSLSEVSELLHNLDRGMQDSELESKSNFRYYLDYARFSKEWGIVDFEGWRLPAQGRAKEYCQKWNFLGCSNINKHPYKQHYAEHQLYQCKTSNCTKCIESWINRNANRGTQRWMKFLEEKPGAVLRSVILSPPPESFNQSYSQLKNWLKQILKIANITTCSIVFHPYRFRDKKKLQPYYSPHFHLITSNYLTNTTEFYNKTKWLIKNKGDLKNELDIFNNLRYVFSHCGVKTRTHSIRWLGDVSYRKLKVEKIASPHFCPYCNLELVVFRLNPMMKCKPPPINFIGLFNSDAYLPVYIEDNETKIPFYELVDQPKSVLEYQEFEIFSFEMQLLQKSRWPNVIQKIREFNETIRKTTLDCLTLDQWL